MEHLMLEQSGGISWWLHIGGLSLKLTVTNRFVIPLQLDNYIKPHQGWHQNQRHVDESVWTCSSLSFQLWFYHNFSHFLSTNSQRSARLHSSDVVFTAFSLSLYLLLFQKHDALQTHFASGWSIYKSSKWQPKSFCQEKPLACLNWSRTCHTQDDILSMRCMSYSGCDRIYKDIWGRRFIQGWGRRFIG